MSIIILVIVGLMFLFSAIVKQDGSLFTDAVILVCCAVVLIKLEKRNEKTNL